MNKRFFHRSLVFLALIAFAIACDKDEPQPQPESINDWIYANMDLWYYWTDEMPANPDKTAEPDVFFESLLSDHDRFSWIQEDYQVLLNSLQGVSKESGYELVLYRDGDGSTNVVGQILYVKPNSPASAAGLDRGDLIRMINEQQITIDNYRTLLDATTTAHTISVSALDISTKTFGAAQTIAMTPIEYTENPNYLDKVFTYDNHRIGYYVYNFFANGTTASPTEYTDEMDQIFSSFQSQGITDLILDFRFNSGGAVSAALNLASLVGRDVGTSNTFVRHEYNEGITAEILADPSLGAGFLTIKYLSKSQNVGGFLGNARVYVLTGSRTASASELIINSLRPFMDVYLVGDTTVGKNLGSISLYQKNNPENTWGMQPIVTKSFNSLDQSDYDSGFPPQQVDLDNSLYLYPLGDPKERLLNMTLEQITGSPVLGRKKDEYGPSLGSVLGHSLDLKKRSGQLVVDPIE